MGKRGGVLRTRRRGRQGVNVASVAIFERNLQQEVATDGSP
jgi:hypothetical protein